MKCHNIFKMPKTIAFYGDSYVTRLQDYCQEDLRVPGQVLWFGKGGLRTDYIKRDGTVDVNAKSKFQILKELKPDVVFINVGGNDLTTTSSPRQVFDRILGLTVELQQAGIKDIYVTEILTRGDFSKCPYKQLRKHIKNQCYNRPIVLGLSSFESCICMKQYFFP